MKALVLCLSLVVISCASTTQQKKQDTKPPRQTTQATTCRRAKYTQSYFEKRGVVFGNAVKPSVQQDDWPFRIFIHTKFEQTFDRRRDDTQCDRYVVIIKLGQKMLGAELQPNQIAVKLMEPGIYLTRKHKRLEINWRASLLTGGFIHKHFSQFFIQLWHEKTGMVFERSYEMTWLCSEQSKLASERLNLEGAYATCPFLADKKTITCSYVPNGGFTVGYQHKCWQ